jgi:hypothetical protein
LWRSHYQEGRVAFGIPLIVLTLLYTSLAAPGFSTKDVNATLRQLRSILSVAHRWRKMALAVRFCYKVDHFSLLKLKTRSPQCTIIDHTYNLVYTPVQFSVWKLTTLCEQYTIIDYIYTLVYTSVQLSAWKLKTRSSQYTIIDLL